MRANSTQGKSSRKKFSLPATHNIDETCEQWKQKNAEARVAEALMRIADQKEAQANEGNDDENDD
ncbi:MAG: hypothetical protein ACFCU8_17355 [Thermosynechococcaceae cyanobacterium]